MPKANSENSTNPTRTATAEALRHRLRRAGLRLEPRGGHFEVHCGPQILLASGSDGKPLTLQQIDELTRRICVDPNLDDVDALLMGE
jgi:hypothetical protein